MPTTVYSFLRDDEAAPAATLSFSASAACSLLKSGMVEPNMAIRLARQL